MKKLLWIKDSKKFWKVFSQEREKSRKNLRNLPFAKKIELLEKWKKKAEDLKNLPLALDKSERKSILTFRDKVTRKRR
ncbi:MAG: hypothetical protein WBC74_02330 [Candidatus Omnitrophota bacterium]